MKMINMNPSPNVKRSTKKLTANTVPGTHLKYFIWQNLAAISNEVEEIRDWTPWKGWKKYPGFVLDLDELRLEYIDIMHFIIEALIMLGLDGDDMARYFYAKMDENKLRQAEGYTHE
jgi:hypothetical protein